MSRRTSADIRNESRFDLLRRVFSHGTVTRAQLATETGLSVATVNTLVEQLNSEGILHEAGRISSHGGRPTTTFQVNGARGHLLGVDVAETYIDVELFDLAFTRVGYSRAELPPAVQSIEDVAAIIGGAVRELLAAHTAEDGTPIDVAGTGVSLPGQVDPTRGVDVFAPNWGWHELPVMEALTNALDGPVVVDNPLMALATGELWFGVGRRYDDFVAVNLGTGVGCGIVLERQLLRGNGNSAGEWGHSTLVWDGRECGCGRHGCVEAYVGVEGIRHTLAEEDPDHDLLQVEHQREFMQNLMRADVTGDPAARRTVERTGDYLAAGLGNLINILNPEHICVRGWITGYVGGSLRDRVAERLESESLPGPLRNVSIEVPDESLGVTLGMAVLAFEGFLERVGLPSSSTIGANAGAPRARAVGAAAGTRIWSGGRAG